MNYPRTLAKAHQRLQGVVIERRDALAVIKAQDTPETLFYVDPPYMPETRTSTGYPIFRLPRRETLILVTGYSVTLRAKIVDRLDELERAKGTLSAGDIVNLWNSPLTLFRSP